jgi:hypothetical protein
MVATTGHAHGPPMTRPWCFLSAHGLGFDLWIDSASPSCCCRAVLLSALLAAACDARPRGGPSTTRTTASVEDSPAAAPLSGTTRNWVVTLEVDEVINGRFVGKRFAFRIHSPARAGIVAGKHLVVEAVPNSDGYTVDETQWHRPRSH